MAQVSHPETEDSIEVEIIDTETHGSEYHQVQAVSDEITLTDESGNAPWVEAEELEE